MKPLRLNSKTSVGRNFASMSSRSLRETQKTTNVEDIGDDISLSDVGETPRSDFDHVARNRSRYVDGCLQKTCLRPHYYLRHQLFLSFGSVSVISLSFVMLTAVLTAMQAGNSVKNVSRNNLEQWAEKKLTLRSRYMAETIDQKFQNYESMAGIIKQVTLDRFAGYPSVSDSQVPFFDVDSSQNVYPLEGDHIPLDWQLESKVDGEGENELMRGRSFEGYLASAVSCAMHMQGACDPEETDAFAHAYHAGCTEAHNNITTGGAVSPTEIFSVIHEKVSDYCSAVLRPLYEYHDDVHMIELDFVNSGAGAMVSFPGLRVDGRERYFSAGCDWMLKENPLNASKLLGSEEDFARCHPADTVVPLREYNPNERPFVESEVLEPNKVHFYGPFESPFQPTVYLFRLGQSVYDRETQELIGTIGINVDMVRFGEIVSGFDIGNSSELMLVRWDEEGRIVASDRKQGGLFTIFDDDVGIDQDALREIQNSFEDNSRSDGYEPANFHTTRLINGHFVSTSPVPIPPEEYDPNYRPQFLVVGFVPMEDILTTVDQLDDQVDDNVQGLIQKSLIAGFAGLAGVLIVIYLVSLCLTKPFSWMNKVGDRIINDFGSNVHELDIEKSKWVRFSPATEITDLASGFRDMVIRFSGKGVARLFKKKLSEVRNPFTLTSNFSTLYARRNEDDFQHRYQENVVPTASPLDMRGTSVARVQWGRNLRASECGDSTFFSTLQESVNEVAQNKKLMRSPLFWWIVGSIAVPLLLAMIIISVLLVLELSRSLPNLTSEVEKVYVHLETGSLLQFTKLRAAFASEVMSAYIRDLHSYTRLTAWLMFGELRRADSYTEFSMAAEECKHSDERECSYWSDPERAVCDCAWDDAWTEECHEYDVNTRRLQVLYYEGQSDDTQANGDRNATSYPSVGDSPGNVSFWPNMTAVPGAEKGSAASGHNTTYDRLRVMSATAVIQIPIYNYGVNSRLTRPLGTYVGFEAGGIFGGYAGCFHYHADYSHFQASNTSTFNEDLCPIEKYGFDPRCRGWYISGKEVGLNSTADLYVTPPYVYAGFGQNGQSAVQSLIDPLSGEYVGATLIDFEPTRVFRSLTQTSTPLINGFHVLVSAREDVQGYDTIVAPDFEFGKDEAAPIDEFLLPHGAMDNEEFRGIVDKMHNGSSAQTTFTRLKEDGSEEMLYFAYAPVAVTNLRAINPSEFDRGVNFSTTTIFSLAMAEEANAVIGAFDSIEDSLQRITNIAISVLAIMMAVAVLAVLYLSSRVTISIIAPVTQLLLVVTKINNREINDDLPSIVGGSSEVARVHQTFELLYMLVRFANTAFFSGELAKAYDSLKEAHELFLKLGNEKAVGIANNNLGNIMLTMYRTMKTTGAPAICNISKSDIISGGISYFDSAIDSGEKALAKTNDEEGWSRNYLVFMQQLSNRYFNRAMFLLNVKDDHPSPEEAEHQGLTDLATSKDMDREVVDNGDQIGFKGDHDLHFDLLICRIKGVLSLLEMGYEDDWGVEDLFDEAISELKRGLKSPIDDLFRDFGAAAQMQRLDSELILYYKLSGTKDKNKAAAISIRMLMEDEYILREAGVSAVNALIEYVGDATAEDLGGEDPSDVRSSLFQFRRVITDAASISRFGKNVLSRESLRMSNMGDISMEMF